MTGRGGHYGHRCILSYLRVEQIYNNTLHNWPLLGDNFQLQIHPILFVVSTNMSSDTNNTNEAINIIETALHLGWTVLEVPRVSHFGMPYVRDMFADVTRRFSNCTFHGYSNGDIIFDDGLALTLHAVVKVRKINQVPGT